MNVVLDVALDWQYFNSVFKILAEKIFNVNMSLLIKQAFRFLYPPFENRIQSQQVRHQFVDWRMLKDYRRRLTVQQYGEEKFRLTVLKKNKVLPPELRALAEEELNALPRNAHRTRLVARCVVTSRSKGVVGRYRVSRIIFRHLADYNCLAGWERAMW